jgi:hypothetical protein
MEVGTLSEYIPPGRAKDSGHYPMLQAWQDGKNSIRHGRPQELSELQETLAGHALFREFTGQ